ncbi:MAG TPA: ABC transporter permease [Candidatus Angelobacter sp.]|nr:ABC transporter permease [Candidatus Angelobacter sp.]
MGTLFNDIKYGSRVYRKRIGFTIVAVLTLALGIGASTAVFVVVDAILLKPLAYPDSERIVISLRQAPPGLNLGYKEIPWGLSSFRLMLQDSKTFQHLGAFKSDSFNLTGTSEPAILQGIRASAGLFPALGVKPVIGRLFQAEEDQPGHDHEILLSYQLWQERFGGNTDVLKRSVDLNSISYNVIGVMPASFVFPHSEEMPASFDFPKRAELWVPLAAPASLPGDAPDDLAVIGRLRPGITVAQAQEEMNVFATRMDGVMGPKGWFQSRVIPLAEQVAGDTRFPLLLILGAVGAVLLIACSNVANLFLALSMERRAEFTLRAAIGAGRARLVRQLFTESFFLGAFGGIAGVLLAYIIVHLLKIFAPSNIPRLQDVGLDPRVAAFCLGITLVSSLLFGLAPVLGLTRDKNIAESLREGGQRSGGSPTGLRARNTLVVVEITLALVLVVATGLLSRTFFHLLGVDGGFNTERVLTFELSLPTVKYPTIDSIVGVYQKVLTTLPSVPGVQTAAIVKTVPLNGATEGSFIRIPGRAATSQRDRPVANYNIASHGYFGAVGTPLLSGREFLESDKADSMPAVIINSAMAKQFWPNEVPIGKQVGLGSPNFPLMNIVGIVANVKHISLREDPGPEMYVPFTQKPYPSMSMMYVVLRTKTDPASVLNSVREAIHSIDPDLPIAEAATLSTIRDKSMSQPRFLMLLLASFGVSSLLLACIGIYGVISYSVMQRTAEMGIRMALGAQRGNVFRMVIGQGVRLAGAGIMIGLVAAFGLTRLMASFLYGVPATDPLTFAGVSLLLAFVALLACYLPARRATHVDPIIALRCE